MKVLVTGATGFTGSHLVKALLSEGHTVRAFVRPSTRAYRLKEPGLELFFGDIRDRNSVIAAARGIDQIYHIAAAFRIAGKSRDYYQSINAGGTKHVLEAARQARVQRVVHCSTVGVHGHVGARPVSESAPFNPGDAYQETKLEGELMASQAFRNGLPGVVFRPSGIYGPGDGRFLKLFRAIKKRYFVMLGSGLVHYNLTYIDDIVRGVLLCGQKKEALGNTYILAGDNLTLKEFAQKVAEAVGAPSPKLRLPLWPILVVAHVCEALSKPLRLPPLVYPRRADFFRKERAFIANKAKTELGWAPQISLEDGLRRTAKWYQDNSWL